MEPASAAAAFSLVLVAELGDKSQLMTIALAHRFRPAPVLAGACSAFLVLNLVAVGIGTALGDVLPERLVLVVAGLLFLAFAVRSWRAEVEEGASLDRAGSRAAFWTSFSLLLVSELGDKTQVAVLTLAAQTGATWSVLVGGTLGLWVVTLVGVLVGARALRRVPPVLVHRAAAVLFGLFGLASLARAALLQVG